MLAGFLSAYHTNDITEKYEGAERWEVLRNFSHEDNLELIVDQLKTMNVVQKFFVFDGICESIASFLAICAILCLKAAVNYKRPADEKDLITFGCLVLGLVIPMLEFALRVGPYTAVGQMGAQAGWTDGDPEIKQGWTGFSAAHFQSLILTVTVVETLFLWLNTFNCLLLGCGFYMLSYYAPERCPTIIGAGQKKLGMLVGCLLILCFVLGIVREAAGAGANAGLIVTLLEALLGLILVPAWFVWLAVGLGRGKSVEEMNADEGVGIEKPEEPEEAVGEIKPPARPAQLKKPKKKAAAAGTTSNPMAEMDLMGSSEED